MLILRRPTHSDPHLVSSKVEKVLTKPFTYVILEKTYCFRHLEQAKAVKPPTKARKFAKDVK